MAGRYKLLIIDEAEPISGLPEGNDVVSISGPPPDPLPVIKLNIPWTAKNISGRVRRGHRIPKVARGRARARIAGASRKRNRR